MILIHLRKAFDTIDQKILLKKLEGIGFLEPIKRWFRSYLCEEILFMEIENQLFDQRKVSCGVPQCYFLGPLMFLVYVDDIHQAVKSNLTSYADDS